MAKAIKVIPATKDKFTALPTASIARRRVAAYARVSTDSDEQFTSYEAQIDYYTQYIKSETIGSSSRFIPMRVFPARTLNAVRASTKWWPMPWRARLT